MGFCIVFDEAMIEGCQSIINLELFDSNFFYL